MIDLEKLKGTETEKNLRQAMLLEYAAVGMYQAFGRQAKKDGYVQMQDIFFETASNESAHGKLWLKALSPNGEMPHTLDLLKTAHEQEIQEGVDEYGRCAEVAEKEGFPELAKLFRGVADIEQEHADRYQKLIDNIDEKEVFNRPEPVVWQCMECGHIERGDSAPEKCPICGHPQSYFEIRATNY